MAYLYKRSNRFWHVLIRHRLTHLVWKPLVEATRRRHVRYRRRFALDADAGYVKGAAMPVPAGV
jgi:hypothetical protein